MNLLSKHFSWAFLCTFLWHTSHIALDRHSLTYAPSHKAMAYKHCIPGAIMATYTLTWHLAQQRCLSVPHLIVKISCTRGIGTPCSGKTLACSRCGRLTIGLEHRHIAVTTSVSEVREQENVIGSIDGIPQTRKLCTVHLRLNRRTFLVLSKRRFLLVEYRQEKNPWCILMYMPYWLVHQNASCDFSAIFREPQSVQEM